MSHKAVSITQLIEATEKVCVLIVSEAKPPLL